MHIRKKSTSILRFCVFAQIIQSWKTLFSKSPLGISAHVHKNCHVSFKIWRICQHTKSNNNGAQNTFTYLKGNIQIVINLEVSAHVRKKLPCLYQVCVYAQIIQHWKTLLSKITIRNFCVCTQKLLCLYYRFAYMHKKSNK